MSKVTLTTLAAALIWAHGTARTAQIGWPWGMGQAHSGSAGYWQLGHDFIEDLKKMGVWTGNPTSENPDGEWGWQWLLVIPIAFFGAIAGAAVWVKNKVKKIFTQV